MSRRPRFSTVSADAYLRDSVEAEMQAGLDQIVRLKGGRSWHLEDARNAPELVDIWDTTILLPGWVFLLELKSNHRGFESAGQAEVAARLNDIRRVVSGVVRPEPVSPNEYSYDELLDILGRA